MTKAIRILDEGLNTALDREEGGELAVNLGTLYDYCIRRLTLANARNDDAMLLEVQRLIEPVAQGVGMKSAGLSQARTKCPIRRALRCRRLEPCPP